MKESQNLKKCAHTFWNYLNKTQFLSFRATSAAQGWTRHGYGQVLAQCIDAHTIALNEIGSWDLVTFNNHWQWMVHFPSMVFSLYRLRWESKEPLFLLNFVPVTETCLAAKAPHACHKDCYDAKVKLLKYSWQLGWEIKGPSKDEKIYYNYSIDKLRPVDAR